MASVDCGSGRPANGTPREALPQCAATAPLRTSRGTASYCMARPARPESSSRHSRSPLGFRAGGNPPDLPWRLAKREQLLAPRESSLNVGTNRSVFDGLPPGQSERREPPHGGGCASRSRQRS
jgi:hypothetical protein